MNLSLWSMIINNKLFIFAADLDDPRMTISRQVRWWPARFRMWVMRRTGRKLVERIKSVQEFNGLFALTRDGERDGE